MASRLEWYGDKITRKVFLATQMGINRTMATCVKEAKAVHGGWINQSGNAERSIRIGTPAQIHGDKVVGVWGSYNNDYFLWLEVGTALRSGYNTLRGAAARVYPILTSLIKQAYGELK